MILDNCPHSTGLFHPDRCPKCEHDQEVALAIFNSNKSPLNFMITSNVSFGYASKVCERCRKKFRFYRKEHSIFDKSETCFHKWKLVCIDCINLETDAI